MTPTAWRSLSRGAAGHHFNPAPVRTGRGPPFTPMWFFDMLLFRRQAPVSRPPKGFYGLRVSRSDGKKFQITTA